MSERAEIAEALGKALAGEVLVDQVARVLYSTAACMYQLEPLCVVLPRYAEEVQAAVEIATEADVPVTPRGAGSSLNGQALGRGLVLDCTKYLNRVLEVDVAARTARVQPGVVLHQLNRQLAREGLRFAPDPSSGAQATLGGMIGANAAGARTLKYGATRQHVLGLRGVLADGTWVQTGVYGQAAGAAQRRLESALSRLRVRHETTIAQCQPRVNKNSSGYHLTDLLSPKGVDLTPLLIGSEGTLAVFTEATLQLSPLPKAAATALFFFRELAAAGEAVCELLPRAPSAIEIVDDNFLALARRDSAQTLSVVPDETRYLLLVEFEGDHQREVGEAIARAREALVEGQGLAFDSVVATDPAAQQKLWGIRKAATPVLNRMKGPRRPLSVIEDAAVAPERLVEYVTELQAVLSAHGAQATIHGHAGNGHLHVRPVLDLKKQADLDRLDSLARETARLVSRLHGTLSAEHGDGFCRTELLPVVYGELYDVFCEVKALFDPRGLLNPGKKVFREGYGLTDNLRYGSEYRRVQTGTRLDREPLQAQAELCHGCGSCRSYCPVFLGCGEEAATARSKANVLRQVISGQLPAEALDEAAVKHVMDLCVNCKQCLTDCPTLVDIPTLAVEARAHYVSRHGQQPRNLLLGLSDLTSHAGQFTSQLANAVNQLQPWRVVREYALGLHRARDLPAFAPVSFFQWLSREAQWTGSAWRLPPVTIAGETPSPDTVVYFAGCFANYCDPAGEAIATVQLLRRCGCEVLVPRFRCCGVALITLGSGDRVRPDAEHNVSTLLPYVEGGATVVASSASCGLALKEEYPQLLETETAERVASQVVDIHELLRTKLASGALPRARLRRVGQRVAYHNPCHLKAQGIVTEPVELLRLIPDLDLVEIEDSCCGIAGTFGMKTENFALSMRMGEPLFAAVRAAHVDRVVSGCGTCNLQLRQGTGLPVSHAVELLWSSLRTRPR